MVQCRAQRQRASGSTQARHNQPPKANKQLCSPREDEALVVLESKSAMKKQNLCGKRLFQQNGVTWWWRKCVLKKLKGLPKPCAKPSKEVGQGGMPFRGKKRDLMKWSVKCVSKWAWSIICRASSSESHDDVLPWMGEGPACPLCTLLATLKHILVGCKTSLTQGRYTWWHNQVLRFLAAELECMRVTTNTMPLKIQKKFPHLPSFICEGEKLGAGSHILYSSPLNAARHWKMCTDLDQRLTFPSEIATTNLWLGLILWIPARWAFVVELGGCWGEAYERKKLHYAEVAAEAEEQGWKVVVRPVEVSCRVCVTGSTSRILREVSVWGQAVRKQSKLLPTLQKGAVTSCGWEEEILSDLLSDHVTTRHTPRSNQPVVAALTEGVLW